MTKVMKTKNKFVIALTVQNLLEDDYEFSETLKGYLQVVDTNNNIVKTFKTEKAFQEWINEMATLY